MRLFLHSNKAFLVLQSFTPGLNNCYKKTLSPPLITSCIETLTNTALAARLCLLAQSQLEFSSVCLSKGIRGSCKPCSRLIPMLGHQYVPSYYSETLYYNCSSWEDLLFAPFQHFIWELTIARGSLWTFTELSMQNSIAQSILSIQQSELPKNMHIRPSDTIFSFSKESKEFCSDLCSMPSTYQCQEAAFT